MGIYDRDYYRDGGGGYWGSLTRRATVWLVAAGALVWLAVVFSQGGPGQGNGRLFDALALTPAGLTAGEVWRLLTAPFVHPWTAFLEVAFGLYTLYVFGSAVEEVIGRREFLALALGVALLGSLADVAVLAGLPGREGAASYGLGCVLVAVVVWYACRFPDARILLMFVLPVPAWVVGVGLALLAASGRTDWGNGPAALLLAAGFAFAHHRLRLRLTDWLPAGGRRRSGGRRLKVYEDEGTGDDQPTPTAGRPAGRPDEQLEAQIDRILEKVSATGRSSLSPDEQQILLRASEVYRRRRGDG